MNLELKEGKQNILVIQIMWYQNTEHFLFSPCLFWISIITLVLKLKQTNSSVVSARNAQRACELCCVWSE